MSTESSKKKVWIVEDEAIIVMLVKHILTRNNYSVVGIADTGEKALVMTESHRPDIILMDISLKGEMDGIEVTTLLAGRFKIPVIYMTSHTDKATYDRAMATRPADYIVKPINDQQLLEALDRALSDDSKRSADG